METMEALQPQYVGDDLQAAVAPSLECNLNLQSYRRPNDANYTWVPLSVISQATGVSTKALRKRVAIKAPEGMVWRPDAAEIKELIDQRAFGPSAQQGVLLRHDFVSTLVPETTFTHLRVVTGPGHGGPGIGELGAKKRKAETAEDSEASTASTMCPTEHKKTTVDLEKQLRVDDLDSEPPPTRHDEVDMPLGCMDRDAGMLALQHADRPVAPGIASIAELAAAAGGCTRTVSIATTDRDTDRDMSAMPPVHMHMPVTVTPVRRQSFISIPDGLDAETRLKLRIIDAVSRSSKVLPAKRHQFRRVATHVVCKPGMAAKRSGSRNTMVLNEDLVKTGLFIETLVPSVGSCLRAIIAIAEDACWKRVAEQIGFNLPL
jgi:hypothetical protein